jgi:trans-2,3-dihydro-3-hydroxyanthranilate isomerase
MSHRFFTLDVFTRRRLAGNPLAVVLEADDLDGDAMQAVAREFNLSETVFVLAPEARASRARLRIFTPTRELPFAGHPTVGTAVLLARLDGVMAARDLVLEERIGPVRCTVQAAGDGGQARFDIPREPVQVGEIADAALVAAALGLTLDDLGEDGFLPGQWSAGNAFTFLPVRGLDAVARSRPDQTHWDLAFGPDDPVGVFVFCRDTVEPGHHFHARMFAPSHGVPEDPATGSAAAAFAGLVARFGGLDDGDHEVAIEQGYEMGRPSQIRLHLTMRARQLTAAAIGGDAVVVTEGTILV